MSILIIKQKLVDRVDQKINKLVDRMHIYFASLNKKINLNLTISSDPFYKKQLIS
jgi:hypothetical protein